MQTPGVQVWEAGAVHDTVAALLRDSAYRRSIWSSLLGRAITGIGRFVQWLVEALQSVPGGKATVLTVLAIVALLIVGRLLLGSAWSDDVLFRRATAGRRVTRIDPWVEAESLAAAGDYMAAAHALYQAVIRRVAASERLRLHASKTSGDYVRDLRRRGSPVAGPFQAFGRRFDRVVFGAGVCTAEDYAAMRNDALAIPEMRAAA